MNKNLFSIIVDYSSNFTVITEPDQSNCMDEGYNSYTHNIDGIYFSNNLDRHCEFYLEDVKDGDIVYLLYATYSAGDSINMHHNNCIEFVGIYKDLTIAEYNKIQLKECDKIAMLLTDSGVEYKYFIPWDNMFSCLEHLAIEEHIIEKKD